MTIIYEVNLEVDSSIANRFRGWLDDHIQQMLTLEGFLAAKLYRVQSENSSFCWCVQYQVQNLSKLQSYFENEAARMREQGIALFGKQMNATRRILEPEI